MRNDVSEYLQNFTSYSCFDNNQVKKATANVSTTADREVLVL